MIDLASLILSRMSAEAVAFFTIVYVLVMGLLMVRMAREIAYWREDHARAMQYFGESKLRGVYRIRCCVNGAEYIGSTKTNFMARWGQHIRDLNNGKHTSPRLQEDWNNYGPRMFQFMIVEVLDDDKVIVERERAIIAERATTVPPILNYNVAGSRIYPVPSPAEQA